MYQQPIPTHPTGTAGATGVYTAPQATTVVPVQGQASPAVVPVGGGYAGATTSVVPGTTGTMPMVGNATMMPTSTATAPLIQQQYMTAPGATLSYARPATTAVAPVAGGYTTTTGMGGYGGGYGSFGYGGAQQSGPSVVVVDNGRRHRSHSHGRHHRHHSHSSGRRGFRDSLKQITNDVRMGRGVGYGQGGYGYGYDQHGRVTPIPQYGHHGGMRRTRSYDSFY